MLKLIIHPNPILRTKSQKVTDVLDSKIQKLIPEMLETMKDSNGVGLAAPQIGQNIRLLVIGHKDKDLVIINPKIIKKSLLKDWDEEGCLSIPHKYGQVKRHKSVTIKYLNEGGQEQTIKANGLLARIIQHEIDHLDGILFIDKVKDLADIEY
ncbi:peptide deformylase [Candidatus Falkowbacteria bacterium]|uniref:Peptide deformylase n=1 Tax=Candidatus Buchananbacteria bacterium CG10_big_fil_rev_8_21_14_0_10_33_19 TaxID=1974525 RepID=A0A2H0W3V7_9BACT|nr:peptide deformylase [Candidatus Falkowbacteria bacterium]PIS05957.1 MAG: peptide deformylase [Candidatus Buchananbacteria bacterium CG10_big_fil_rev_8_21_14_0_10_33_19]